MSVISNAVVAAGRQVGKASAAASAVGNKLRIGPGKVAAATVVGGLAGAIFNRATTDKQSPTGKARESLFGGLVGAGIGFGGSAILGGLMKKGSITRGTMKGMAKSSWGTTKGLARFARHHPIAAGLGLGIAGLLAYGGIKSAMAPDPTLLSDYSPGTGTSSTGFDPGFGGEFSQPEHQRFIASTQNLVQGLHRNRH